MRSRSKILVIEIEIFFDLGNRDPDSRTIIFRDFERDLSRFNDLNLEKSR